MSLRFSNLRPGTRFTLRCDNTREELLKLDPDCFPLGDFNAASLADGTLSQVDPSEPVIVTWTPENVPRGMEAAK